MKYFFYTLLAFALAAGVFGVMINRNTEGQGVIGKFLHLSNVKQTESKARIQIRNQLQFIEFEQELIRERQVIQQEKLLDQQERLKSLSADLQEAIAYKGFDPLRSKELVDSLNDQQSLLIEKGRELMANQKEFLDRMRQNNVLKEIDDQRWRDNYDKIVSENEEIKSQEGKYQQSLQEQNARLREKLNMSMRNMATELSGGGISSNQLDIPNNETAISKIEERMGKMIETIEKQQEDEKVLNEKYQQKIEDMRQQIMDSIDHSQSKMKDAMEKLKQKQESTEDHIRDQMERIKENQLRERD